MNPDFYKEHKLDPPTRDVHWKEEEFREELERQKKRKCQWTRQKGPYLLCEESCQFKHAVYIGTNLKFQGLKDGKPIFDKISLNSNN